MRNLILVALILISFNAFANYSVSSSKDPERKKSKKYDLNYELEKGTSLTLSYSRNFRRTSDIQGDITGNTIKDDFTANVKVLSSHKKTGLALNIELIKISRNRRNPGGNFNDEFPDMINYEAEINLSSKGKISGYNKFKDIPQQEVWLRRTTPQQFVHSLKNILTQLPEDPVSIGETWSYVTEDEMEIEGAKSKVVTNYTCKPLEEIEKDGYSCLNIEIKYTESFINEGERYNRNFTHTMDGEGIETIYFAYNEGMLIAKEGSYKQKGKVTTGMEIYQKDEIKYKFNIDIKNNK
jgi:hypothetical protein